MTIPSCYHKWQSLTANDNSTAINLIPNKILMKIHEKSATMKSLQQQQQQNQDLETTHRSYATRRLKRLWQTLADLHRLA